MEYSLNIHLPKNNYRIISLSYLIQPKKPEICKKIIFLAWRQISIRMQEILRQLLEHYLAHTGDNYDQGRMEALYNYSCSLLKSNLAPTISHPSLSIVSGAVHRQLLKRGQSSVEIEEFDRWAKSAFQVIGEPTWKVLYFLWRLIQPDTIHASTIGSHSLIETIENPLPILAQQTKRPAEPNPQDVTITLNNQDFLRRQRENIKGKREKSIHEVEIMQDLFYPLQGKDGKFVVWSDESDNFIPRFGYNFEERTKNLINKIVQVGVKYRKLLAEIMHYRNLPLNVTSETQRSFYVALDKELQLFYIKGILEYETLVNGSVPNSLSEVDSLDHLSLFNFLAWIREPDHRLSFLVHLFKELKGKPSGEILNELARFSRHRVLNIGMPASRILQDTILPFWNGLCTWLTKGETSEEFFVKFTSEQGWKRCLQVQRDKLPEFIFVPEVVDKILSIGKCQKLGTNFENFSGNSILGMFTRESEPVCDFISVEKAINQFYKQINKLAFEKVYKQFNFARL